MYKFKISKLEFLHQSQFPYIFFNFFSKKFSLVKEFLLKKTNRKKIRTYFKLEKKHSTFFRRSLYRFKIFITKINQTKIFSLENYFFLCIQMNHEILFFQNIKLLLLLHKFSSLKSILYLPLFQNEISIKKIIQNNLMLQTDIFYKWSIPKFKLSMLPIISKKKFVLISNAFCKFLKFKKKNSICNGIYEVQKKKKLVQEIQIQAKVKFKITDLQYSSFSINNSFMKRKNIHCQKESIHWGSLKRNIQNIKDDLVFLPSKNPSRVFKPIFLSFLPNLNFRSKNKTLYFNSFSLLRLRKNSSKYLKKNNLFLRKNNKTKSDYSNSNLLINKTKKKFVVKKHVN